MENYGDGPFDDGSFFDETEKLTTIQMTMPVATARMFMNHIEKRVGKLPRNIPVFPGHPIIVDLEEPIGQPDAQLVRTEGMYAVLNDKFSAFPEDTKQEEWTIAVTHEEVCAIGDAIKVGNYLDTMLLDDLWPGNLQLLVTECTQFITFYHSFIKEGGLANEQLEEEFNKIIITSNSNLGK